MNLQIIIWIAMGVAEVAALLFLFILLSRVHEATYDRWYAKRRDVLLAPVCRYICGDGTLQQLCQEIGKSIPVAEDLILYFLNELSAGEARLRLLQAADELGLLQKTLRNLHSLDWTKRDISAMHLGIYGLQETVPDLVGLLRDRRLEVRYTAARSLGLIGSPEAVKALISILDYPELLDTPRVLEIVHSMGAQASEPLKRLLEHSGHRPEIKLLAIDLIGDLRMYSMVSELHETLHSLNTEEALRAVRALGKFSAPQSTSDIVHLVNDRSWQVRAQAVKAIGMLQIDAGLPALLEALRDESYWVRFNAAQAMVTLGDEGIKALAGARWVKDKFTRDVAQYQIERLNGKLELLGLEHVPATPEVEAVAAPEMRHRIPSVVKC
jgi:HEAT repeat protein